MESLRNGDWLSEKPTVLLEIWYHPNLPDILWKGEGLETLSVVVTVMKDLWLEAFICLADSVVVEGHEPVWLKIRA